MLIEGIKVAGLPIMNLLLEQVLLMLVGGAFGGLLDVLQALQLDLLNSKWHHSIALGLPASFSVPLFSVVVQSQLIKAKSDENLTSHDYSNHYSSAQRQERWLWEKFVCQLENLNESNTFSSSDSRLLISYSNPVNGRKPIRKYVQPGAAAKRMRYSSSPTS
jgi:hypothetical protein